MLSLASKWATNGDADPVPDKLSTQCFLFLVWPVSTTQPNQFSLLWWILAITCTAASKMAIWHYAAGISSRSCDLWMERKQDPCQTVSQLTLYIIFRFNSFAFLFLGNFFLNYIMHCQADSNTQPNVALGKEWHMSSILLHKCLNKYGTLLQWQHQAICCTNEHM